MKIPKYNPNLDYCSFSPEGMFGCKYNYACYLHDRQYRNEIPKNQKRQSRLVSDFALWKNIIKECWKVRKTSIFWSWRVGLIYFLAVRLFARRHYK